jgi:hypothetical protein
MAPLPISSALTVSILQIKTPPDMQGRVFALVRQLGFAGATASFLLVGPLVDQVLGPAAAGPHWARGRGRACGCCWSPPAWPSWR